MVTKIKSRWIKFWMNYSGMNPLGRFATRLAVLLAEPYTKRFYLAGLNRKGYISPKAILSHADLHLGSNVFIGDRVLIHQSSKGGPVEIGDRVYLVADIYIQTGQEGRLKIGSDTCIQARCQFSAYLKSIEIGRDVQIAPSCAFYPYNHGLEIGIPMREQPLTSKGGIIIGDDALLGYGVIVLAGVRIGNGAVIGAGSVVTKDIPDKAIAAGVPARVFKFRGNSETSEDQSSNEVKI